MRNRNALIDIEEESSEEKRREWVGAVKKWRIQSLCS
jgi:hypothetical protein